MAEVIDIGSLDSIPSFSLNDGRKSTNFGGGIELLMNNKVKEGKGRSDSGDVDLGELTELENELNELSDTPRKKSSNADFFKLRPDDSDDDDHGGNSNSNSNSNGGGLFGSIGGSGLGASTSKVDESAKTWDGYGKFNNIPIDPDMSVEPQPQLTKEEMLREKFKMLKKLEELEAKGVQLTKKYSMESSLTEMKGEYETHIEERERKSSVRFQRKMLLACITGLEYLNNKFDPFDLKLDDWSEQINENIEDYDDIFAELHEKYKSKAKMAPELKLLFQIGGSAIMLHMTNTMFKSALPGMDDIMRQNPELMQQFTQAAVNSMSSSVMGGSGGMGGGGGSGGMGGGGNSGFGNFMNDIMGSRNQRPPPAPIATKGPAPSERNVPPPGYNPRPDLTASRGGIDITDNYEPFNARAAPPPPLSTAAGAADKSSSRSKRPDMKGPSASVSDVSSLLSGLKTKTISIPAEMMDATSDSVADRQQQQLQPSHTHELEAIQLSLGGGGGGASGGMLSASDMKDLQLQSETAMPHKTKRRPRSEKNSMSLDI